MDTLLLILVLLFGALITGLGGYGIVSPVGLVQLVMRSWGKFPIYAVAIGARIVLGVVLIAAAPLSRFPLVFEVLGWISIVAALSLALLGRERFRRLISWFEARATPSLTRVACAFAIVFGVFLIHAVT